MPRPRSVTFLAVVVLSLAVFNLLGAVRTLRDYTLLSQLNLSLAPSYLITRHVIWTLLFALFGVGLWRLKEWGRRGTLAAVALYLAVSWVERLVFAQSEYSRLAWLYDLLLQVAGLASVWGILLRRKVRAAFSA